MASHAPSATIVVVGDTVVDVSLIRSPVPLSYHAQALPSSALKLRAGGAWFLRDMVRVAFGNVSELDLSGPKKPDPLCACEGSESAQAFQVWQHFEKSTGKPKDRVWRISEFLGCQRPAPDDERAYPGLDADPSKPHVLVIDDLGLGFTGTPRWWPTALSAAGDPGAIIVKTGSLPDGGEFWTRLTEMADKVTVVMSVDSLRQAGAPISTPLSWDKAIEEIKREFAGGLAARPDASADSESTGYHGDEVHKGFVGGMVGDRLTCFKRVVIRFGLEGAASFTRLPLGSPKADRNLSESMRFERFLYRPDVLPGDSRARMPGTTFGANSVLTAAIVRHELHGSDYPLFIALGRALEAARASHEVGAGDADREFRVDGSLERIGEILAWDEGSSAGDAGLEPAAAFCSAFDHEAQDEEFRPKPINNARDDKCRIAPGSRSRLLVDLAGDSREFMMAKAVEVVLRGPDEALAAAPKATYEKYVTADREEIERINAVRNLIETYRENSSDNRPLSIAVFGPPGAGKSFAIKNLAKVLFGPGQAKLEFNLSQMTKDDLATAFQHVRDASIRGLLPLVFWDEFDTDGQTWLQDFLAPMQDAEFQGGGGMHPLGKCIFVFAGSTCHQFERFAVGFPPDGTPGSKRFVELKGPDFVSRLRGYLNVKGPNPQYCSPCVPVEEGDTSTPPSFRERAKDDPEYLIRRAIILRSAIAEFFPHLVDTKTGQAAASTALLKAFLEAGDYAHGARSISAIVGMSSVGNAQYYNATQLPAEDFIRMHVDGLLEHLYEPELELPVIEELAKACHTYWLLDKLSSAGELRPTVDLNQGYQKLCDMATSQGVRDACDPQDALQQPYEELREAHREASRITARLTAAKLAQAGYRIAPGSRVSRGHLSAAGPDDDVLRKLYRVEHDIWMRDRLLKGFEYCKDTDKALFLHEDVTWFDEVPEEHRSYDKAIVASIFGALQKHGYLVVPREKHDTK